MSRLSTLFTLIFLALLSFAPLSQAQDNGRTILVLDASGSMWGQIDGVAKITIAQQVIGDLLNTIPTDQALGLTAYGHRRKGDCGDIETLVEPGTQTRDAIARAVNAIKPKGKTPLSAAVIAAAKTLEYTETKATVILVSDGRETCEFDPCAVGAELEASGVDFTAHVIGFDVASLTDRAQLQCLAENTGGSFRTAGNAAELADALKEVAEPVPALPAHVKFVAIEGENGPVLDQGLIWSLTNLKTGDVLVDNAHAAGIERDLPAGRYHAEVTQIATEASAQAEIDVASSGNMTVKLILPLELPPATLQAPKTAVAGQMVTLSWTGPDQPDDYIATAHNDQRDTARITFAATKSGSPLQIQMPPEPGIYEIRYVMDTHGIAIAKVEIEVLPLEITIDIPDTAMAGETLTLSWSGPNYPRDTISTALPEGRAGAPLTSAYTSTGSPIELTMPPEPGEYEVRYVLSQSATIAFHKSITITPVTASLNAPDTAGAGEVVSVNWKGPNYARDYLSVAEITARDSLSIERAYTANGSPSQLKMPLTPGTYEIRYVQNQDSTILARRTIEIQPIVTRLTVPETAYVGSALNIEWIGPNHDRDYISVAEIGSRDTKYIHNSYTGEGAPTSVQMPARPGIYEIRYLANGSPDQVLARTNITLLAVSANLDAPTSADAGETLSVEWTGPDYRRDYVAIAAKGGDRYKTRTLTNAGTPLDIKVPDTPGQYELWYVMNQGKTILARRDLTVK